MKIQKGSIGIEHFQKLKPKKGPKGIRHFSKLSLQKGPIGIEGNLRFETQRSLTKTFTNTSMKKKEPLGLQGSLSKCYKIKRKKWCPMSSRAIKGIGYVTQRFKFDPIWLKDEEFVKMAKGESSHIYNYVY